MQFLENSGLGRCFSNEAFVTDADGRIVREITPQRVKRRVSNALPIGTVRETFSKFDGAPAAEDLKILDSL